MSDPIASKVTTSADPANPAEPIEQDKPLGEGGEKALKAEREARKAAEATIAEYKAKEDDAAKANLSEIERAQADTQSAVKRAEEAESALAVHRLAIKHGITDDDDLELLSAAPDDATRERLALRIAKPGTATTPKPDRSQGASGQSKKPSTGEQFEDFFENQLS